jgi:DNA-binding response OmpR family regulator
MKILVVEDDTELGPDIIDYLSRSQYVCDRASSLHEASARLTECCYSGLVLDTDLRDGSGLSLLHQLRKLNKDLCVIIISSNNTLESRLEGLQSGADDYLVKPFYFAELVARMDAIVRRRQFHNRPTLDFKEIVINLEGHTALVNSQHVELTRKEFELLVYLVTNQENSLTKAAIAEHIWGEHLDNSDKFDFLYTHVKNLKRKLHEAGSRNYIHTIYGHGYRFGKESVSERTS